MRSWVKINIEIIGLAVRQIVAGVLGSVLLLAVIIMLSVYRVWKEEQEIIGLLWKIDPRALTVGNPPLSDSKVSLRGRTE